MSRKYIHSFHYRSSKPIETTLEELYKPGPGPSSSHTMGPMYAGYDFYKLVKKLPKETLDKTAGIRVVLLGSLSATGKGHGTDRAVLAGILGKSPYKCDFTFLDELAEDPEKIRYIKIKDYSWPANIKSVEFGSTTGSFPHPNTMIVQLLSKTGILLEKEYYSVGGGFIEWQGYAAPKRPEPPFPYHTFEDLKNHAENNGSLVKTLLDNEMTLTGHCEEEVWQFLDTIIDNMNKSVHNGLVNTKDLPGSICLKSKACALFRRYHGSEEWTADRSITVLASLAIAAAEENARGHIIVTAPTAGSAGVVAAAVAALSRRQNCDRQKIREGLLIAAAMGYLCKHNATLSGAEGGCQAEIGVASAMAAALIAHVNKGSFAVIENAAESALEHHLGLTCDPVGGYVQVPCIERCAFGVVKAWTATCIAAGEFPNSHVVSFDDCVEAMSLTAKAMSSKYKETSEGGLAQVFC